MKNTKPRPKSREAKTYKIGSKIEKDPNIPPRPKTREAKSYKTTML